MHIEPPDHGIEEPEDAPNGEIEEEDDGVVSTEGTESSDSGDAGE